MPNTIFSCRTCETPYLETDGELADYLLCDDCVCRDRIPEHWLFESDEEARTTLRIHNGTDSDWTRDGGAE